MATVEVNEIITLKLNRKEAETLAAVVGCIHGCMRNSRRRYTSNIFDALTSADIDFSTMDLKGTLTFSTNQED
jgi:hypothetical protein